MVQSGGFCLQTISNHGGGFCMLLSAQLQLKPFLPPATASAACLALSRYMDSELSLSLTPRPKWSQLVLLHLLSLTTAILLHARED